MIPVSLITFKTCSQLLYISVYKNLGQTITKSFEVDDVLNSVPEVDDNKVLLINLMSFFNFRRITLSKMRIRPILKLMMKTRRNVNQKQ